ncbi:hypothetical protein BBO99_00002996 [Phytophthora kernoviae]|uniref:Uncharacterized protein n=2 Tax=Phytophthora kernoviae TaxID=325452 RepID=A0A3F2RVW6_9STRA|nr:hypothetical protein G195_003457 [Phytophthora kernoviae 00238/432]KAG2528609.1 hypothetical protein JM16_002681 [Phytophthora kernoviae]KAG2529067.1 hypothetical protein JM18_002542 [Phytophthora kernoviae]RLN10112.1 hypothetical protein BBI17_003060 [Phytophthora kernoviae]RLN65245.1 hypothetical protein BBP00_00002976 [Phytophthora kernoviae]
MDPSSSSLVGDVHANGGDIDSLLSNDPDVSDKTRRLLEPYERHRAHDLRAECYRRGIRPIKKGPNANDNKNGYTQNVAADGQLCGNCRTVITDQLMDSIRLGKTKMQLQEMHKLTDQRDRDTSHLKEVLGIITDLRKAYREAQASGMNHELLIELQDDMAFFRTLKERTKERMRQAMQEARERAAKSNATA